MTTAPVKLLHFSPRVASRGGVESLLARHAGFDRILGFDAVQFALFDPAPAKSLDHYSTQSFSWKSTPAQMRRQVARAMERHAGSIVIWHGGWGMPWFADGDASLQRILYFHGNEENCRPWLAAVGPWLDGVICVNPDAARAARRLLPGVAPERITALRLPITPPPNLVPERPVRSEWVIGCGGRLERPQKRADRMLPFVEELARLGVSFRLEVMGDGALASRLRRCFRGNPAVHFI